MDPAAAAAQGMTTSKPAGEYNLARRSIILEPI